MDGAAGATFLVLPLDPDGQGAGTAFDPEALRAGLASDGGPSVFDACLGVALARSLERKLGAAGAHVLSARAGTRACEALGLEVPLDEEAARLVLRYAGATRLLQGTFEREAGKLALALSLFEVGEGESPPEPARILASGEVSAFQGVLERAAQEIVTQSGRTLPASFPRETESWDAYMALARAQAALLQGDVAAAEDELAAAQRLDPLYVEPHEVAANAARDMGD